MPISDLKQGSDSESTSLTIAAQAADNPPTFSSTDFNISSRSQTAQGVNWNNIASWSDNSRYNTPDISPVIQAVVDRAGWSSGIAMVLLIEGTGKRLADARDEKPDYTAELHVTYQY